MATSSCYTPPRPSASSFHRFQKPTVVLIIVLCVFLLATSIIGIIQTVSSYNGYLLYGTQRDHSAMGSPSTTNDYYSDHVTFISNMVVTLVSMVAFIVLVPVLWWRARVMRSSAASPVHTLTISTPTIISNNGDSFSCSDRRTMRLKYACETLEYNQPSTSEDNTTPPSHVYQDEDDSSLDVVAKQ